ncbi:Zn-dependent exopeptidase [Eremomyces bilateralis CBS 781.70]|uniref:Zn-dependent exopeptidase n=1 Tax=Eremomyces bilateralis CBS 781.70 TaxID=1392243 RepID=A0A6G1GDU2_9PEZI|nr:Zn-dependent exopeptidase [Eremomyces bilateralis CBS 781.70]KAF1816285.1 Zn-dependent exopeptidase [Eremomyces bilateralis CBS 781.70]
MSSDSPPNEQTPLITIVHVAPLRRRYPHQRLRQFCTGLLSLVLILFVVAFFLLAFVFEDCKSPRRLTLNGKHHLPCIPHHPFREGNDIFRVDGTQSLQDGPSTSSISQTVLFDILSETPDEQKVREWSQYYTAGPHLAGKNLSQAEWTKDRWVEFGIPQTEIVSYDIYVNYPRDHRLALLEKTKSGSDEAAEWGVKYEASLEEDVLDEDGTSGLKDRIPTFHGYSASGNVTGQYVFANYGTYSDFEELQNANVSLEGKIALIKYGGIFRGLTVKRGQELGMIGAVLYSDPGDDGAVTEENGEEAYPNGPAREPSSVQRGSVQFLSIAPGDPTTPGYPSKPGVPRLPANASTPSIPSIPISYQDALPLLKALNGHGPNATSFSERWQRGGLGYKGVEYNVGPSPAHLQLNLVNDQEYVITPMWNVIGIINGTLQDEVVILGNHRDAWVAGGAGDPNSGSAAMIEVVRSFGKALEAGWKPLRTIVLASWDGEEYGLLGSTEWVEEYLPWLNSSAVAYLNVDVGSSGPHFKAAAAPLLNQILVEVIESVQSPNQTVKGQTVADVWNKKIATMGSGSDFTAFQDFAGIPSIDIGFSAEPGSAIYHYHSNYDSFDWMDRLGDPGWHYHVTIAKVWALLAARIVEKPVVAFNAKDYAEALIGYLDGVKNQVSNSTALQLALSEEGFEAEPATLFPRLTAALDVLLTASESLDAKAAVLKEKLGHDIPWWKWWKKIKLYHAIRKVNTKYKLLERKFLYQEGLDGRPWYKHTVFAPGLWTGYSGATFPGLVESIEQGDTENLRKWEGILADVVKKAIGWLEK